MRKFTYMFSTFILLDRSLEFQNLESHTDVQTLSAFYSKWLNTNTVPKLFFDRLFSRNFFFLIKLRIDHQNFLFVFFEKRRKQRRQPEKSRTYTEGKVETDKVKIVVFFVLNVHCCFLSLNTAKKFSFVDKNVCACV